MIPGWMNLYALLMIATSLATVTGIQDVITILNTSIAMESELALVYFYLTVLFLFFAYCYPIALFARRLERAVKGKSMNQSAPLSKLKTSAKPSVVLKSSKASICRLKKARRSALSVLPVQANQRSCAASTA